MKVSVLVKTYNHASLVEQTLGSVLAQRAPFEWEAVVADDASTDGTRAVLQSVAERAPTRIRLMLRERNLGPVANFIETLAACRGAYIALLDGDDYFIDPEKLARQAQALDADARLPATTHDARRVDADGRDTGERYCGPKVPRALTLERLLRGNPVPACGLMFRRSALGDLPRWFHDLRYTDWALHVLLATVGPIAFDPAPLAAYRVHGEGMWSGQGEVRRLEATIDTLGRFLANLPSRHAGRIRARRAKYRLRLASAFASTGQRDEMRRALRSACADAGSRLPLLVVSGDFLRLLPRLAGW